MFFIKVDSVSYLTDPDTTQYTWSTIIHTYYVHNMHHIYFFSPPFKGIQAIIILPEKALAKNK